MKLLRTIRFTRPWFTRLVVGLFLAAQFGGMVSSPRANALPVTATASHADASAAHHRHAQDHHAQAPDQGSHGMPCGHHDHGGSPADACCALHACFAGLLPPVIAVAADFAAGEQLSPGPDDRAPGAPGNRLDRPPRPLH
jgi:hypothetical protein